MTTNVECPHCRTSLRIREEIAHRLIRCPRCKENFRLAGLRQARGVPQAGPRAAPLPKAPARGGHNHATPLGDDSGTLLGNLVPADQAPPPAPRRAPSPTKPRSPTPAPPGKGGGLMWAVLGSILTILLIGGGIAGYYYWKMQPNGSSGDPDKTRAANPAFGKWGIIEIGSKGIKAFVIDVFEDPDDKDGYDFKFDWKAEANPTLVGVKKGAREFDPKALADAEEHIRKFHATIREKVTAPERIYVVSSSGLWVPFLKDRDALKKNKGILAERVQAVTGAELHFISALEEGVFGMKSCVPPQHWKKSLYLDIGSGNVKGGFFESGEVFEGVDADVGSKTFVDKVKAMAKPDGSVSFADQLAAARPALLDQELRRQLDRKPGLGQQERIDLAGGAVWALTTYTHPNDSKDRVELTAADIVTFAALVRKPKDEMDQETLNQVKDPKKKEKLAKEIKRVRKAFNPENLQAAAEILTGLSKEFDFGKKRLYFFRRSYVAWPLGYVLQKNKIRK